MFLTGNVMRQEEWSFIILRWICFTRLVMHAWKNIISGLLLRFQVAREIQQVGRESNS